MIEQNIYDNQTFFDGDKKLRYNTASADARVEKPALFSLSPDLSSKTVLDVGCGYGENCLEFSKLGANPLQFNNLLSWGRTQGNMGSW